MPTILVVDDDISVRAMTRLFLTRKGYAVLEAINGLEAESIAEAESPDLILLDIMMPDQDGFITCANLRTKGYTRPIMLITALHFMRGETQAEECGANGYLRKPVTGTLLLNVVAEALKGSG